MILPHPYTGNSATPQIEQRSLGNTDLWGPALVYRFIHRNRALVSQDGRTPVRAARYLIPSATMATAPFQRDDILLFLESCQRLHIFLKVFIWLHWVLVEAHGIFSCSMCDLLPWPGVKPRSPALGACSLSHWTTKDSPKTLETQPTLEDVPWPAPFCHKSTNHMHNTSMLLGLKKKSMEDESHRGWRMREWEMPALNK